MALLVIGLLLSAQTNVASLHQYKNWNELSYRKLVHFPQDAGASHLSRLQDLTKIAYASSIKNSENVDSLKSNQHEKATCQYS